MAAECEHALVAHWWGWPSLDAFYEALDGDAQARCIAAYRIEQQMQAVLSEHHSRQHKNRRRRS